MQILDLGEQDGRYFIVMEYVRGFTLAHVISQVRRATQALEVGGLREVIVRAENLVVLVHVLNSEYFVACALKPEANAGKARYLLRLMAPQIQSEL